ncbi:MAG: hypothetical protein HW421_410 [Ignavibacteria bacterium]|nr:hypothetical protein [Ignavibacteria bacterium]
MKWIEKILEVKPYTIKTLWNDGSVRLINLEEFIKKKSLNPNSSFKKLKNSDVFIKVKCDGTSLYWENLIKYKDLDGGEKDGNLDISPELLFELSYTQLKQVI